MTPSTGMPPREGRYVVFVRCEGAQVNTWVEPLIATYTPGKWHVPDNRGVFGWIGPLPVMRVLDFFEIPENLPVFEPKTQEYDL